jgi:LITAF-like zinc ribbon domain
MISDFKTPERVVQMSVIPNTDLNKNPTNCIFSSSSKSRRSCLSEKRYNLNNLNPLDQIDQILEEAEIDIKSSKLLKFDSKHTRKISHTRQRSIGDIEDLSKLNFKKETSTRNTSKAISICTEDSRSPSHLRNVSDADSVVYILPEEGKHSFDVKLPFMIGKENTYEPVKGSVVLLGSTPCAAYCRYCKSDVHTKVELYNAGISSGILKLFSSIFTCCNGPLWLSKLRVHKCPNCSLILAKCR